MKTKDRFETKSLPQLNASKFCFIETPFSFIAFSMAGFDSYDVNMNSIIQKSFKLDNFQGVVFCGGFSFGDVLGAGSGWANKILHNSALKDEFQKFFSDQTIDNIEKNYLS